VDGVTIARQTPSMFQLISTTCNKNLSSTPADLCLNVTLYGLFNNIKPYVVACWQRICNSSTNGVQQLVSYFGPYVGQSYPANETGYVMTVMAPPTLSSVLGLCPSASMSSFASLELAGNFCYNGQHQVTYRNTYSHTGCSLLCLNCPLCLGVSFVSSQNLCHVITEDTDLNPGLLDNSTNCLLTRPLVTGHRRCVTMGKEKSSSSSVLQAHYSEIKEELLMPDIVINQPSFTSPSKTKGNIGAIGSFEHADEGNVQHAQLHHNDIVEADSNEVAKELELELPDQRVSHGEVAKFVLPDSQSHIPGVENEAQRSDSKDQDDMLLPYDAVDLRDVFKTQLVLRHVRDMSSQTD
ncbi:hypothetical protein BgiBS90_017980, partial [Biomphalaria glabrata]